MNAHTASASGTPKMKTGINNGAKKKNVTPLAGGCATTDNHGGRAHQEPEQ